MKRIRLTVVDGDKMRCIDMAISDEDLASIPTETVAARVLHSMSQHIWCMLKETDQ